MENQKYIGVKILKHAEEMTHGEYALEKYGEDNLIYTRDFSKENKESKGYKVVYEDGYVSWSPKEVFEAAYRKTDGMTYGLAVEAGKKGFELQRKGWNGNGMWLEVQFPDENSKMTHPYFVMNIPNCEEGLRKLPWQPAQVDLFANDWSIYKA